MRHLRAMRCLFLSSHRAKYLIHIDPPQEVLFLDHPGDVTIVSSPDRAQTDRNSSYISAARIGGGMNAVRVEWIKMGVAMYFRADGGRRTWSGVAVAVAAAAAKSSSLS